MKFKKWKKDIKKVHNLHVKNMIIVIDPKSSRYKKDIARDNLKALEDVEISLEKRKFR